MNVPNLRFKDHLGRDYPEWQVMRLGDILTFKNGVNATKEQYGHGIKFINVLDIINNDFITYENIIGAVNISPAEFEKNDVKFGDVLFQRSSETRDEVGQSNVYLGQQPVTFGGFVIRGRGKESYNPRFMNAVLKTSSVRNEITQRSGGSTRYNIGQDSLSVIPILMPTIPEQIKIADFLTAVDEKISQLSKKCDLLTQYKKGVMQQIFNQELRFKDDDGREFPEWEERQLGDIGSIVTGKTPSTADGSLWGGDVLFVTPSDMTDGKYQFATQRTVTNTGKLKILPKHSIMFTCIASIGKMSLSVFPCVTNQQINTLIPKSSLDNEFVYYAMLNIADYIKSTQANTTLPIINKTEFSKFTISIPARKEQSKIANFLSAIDDKITTTQSQLDAVKQYKQGLLQQMFV